PVGDADAVALTHQFPLADKDAARVTPVPRARLVGVVLWIAEDEHFSGLRVHVSAEAEHPADGRQADRSRREVLGPGCPTKNHGDEGNATDSARNADRSQRPSVHEGAIVVSSVTRVFYNRRVSVPLRGVA